MKTQIFSDFRPGSAPTFLLTFSLVFLFAACSKPSSPPPAEIRETKASTQDIAIKQMQERIEEQEKKIAELKVQLNAKPKPADAKADASPKPVKIEDPVDRLKSAIARFPAEYGAYRERWLGNWSLDTYDIRKTDSVVTPLSAVLIFRQEHGKKKSDYNQRYIVVFALQDNFWVIKSLRNIGYTYDGNTERDNATADAKIGEETDPHYPLIQFLEKHFK